MFLSTKKFVLIALCLLCSATFILAQDDMSDVKDQIQEMNMEVEKAVLSGNTESLLNYYTDDVISMPSYQPMMKGKAAMKESMMKEKDSGMKMSEFDLTTTDVFGSGDLVVEIGTYDLTLSMTGMPEPINDHGKYLTIYEKQDDGTLKVKAETWNTDVNPWQGMEHMDQDMDDKMDDSNMEENNQMEGTDQD